jgi:ankyrin repeat protein
VTADELAVLIERGENARVRDALHADPALLNAPASHGETPLHVACRAKMAKIVAMLIARGADVNARDATGRTPLHAAVSGGGGLAMTLVDGLLNFGADPSLVDNAGQTVADVAATEPSIDVDALLARLQRPR